MNFFVSLTNIIAFTINAVGTLGLVEIIATAFAICAGAVALTVETVSAVAGAFVQVLVEDASS